MSRKEREAELAFEQELLLGGVTDVLNAIVFELGITQRELAERLGVTEGRVSQILSSSQGLTLSTLAAFGRATGLRFEFVPTVPDEGSPTADRRLPWLEAVQRTALSSADATNAPRSSLDEGGRHPKRVRAHRPRRQTRKEVRAVARNERHVVPNSGGGWDIKAPDADRSSGHFDRQSEAIDRARQIVRNTGGGEIVIHDQRGRVRDSDTVPPGNDPNPPRDRR